MHQTSIDFDICSARHQRSPESVAAFNPESAESDRKRVYQAIVDAGGVGLTCDELAAKWGVGQNQISGRFSWLKLQGLIQQNGTRETRAGKQAAVYTKA
jgi:hypothetical protein